MELSLFYVLLVSLACGLSVEGTTCLVGKQVQESDQVSLSSCDVMPCKLKRKSTVTVEVKFTPEEDVQTLKNSVHADILGVPFPFIGVDGNSVCGKIFDAKTGAKAECPLKKGNEYVYKDEFKVLEVYPKIKVTVKWSLKDQSNQSVACFQVPAKITSSITRNDLDVRKVRDEIHRFVSKYADRLGTHPNATAASLTEEGQDLRRLRRRRPLDNAVDNPQ